MTKISGDWVGSPSTRAVMNMLLNAGYQSFFVGGCVRNALLGVAVADIDISTNALPETVIDLAERSGLTAIPTGIDHGTVTVVSGKIPYEITTFRKDIETDGRRAVVAFSVKIEEDAHRRDFTMNALYADAQGNVQDPLGGQKDLQDRRVVFIDDANARIKEDYLRILRFFRFHAWYGDPEPGLDSDGLAACAANLAGLETLSNERVGSELMKLLSAPAPGLSVSAMARIGVLTRIIPGSDDRYLPILVHFEASIGIRPDPILRLASLGGENVNESLRLSRADARRRSALLAAVRSDAKEHELGYRLGEADGLGATLLRSAFLERPPTAPQLAEVSKGGGAVFPVAAADLMPQFEGPALGQQLKQLEAAWIESGFTLGRDELLA